MLLLNPDSRRAKTDILHRSEMHKTIMRLLPEHMGESPREQANLLWRTDERNGFTQLFVQSTMELRLGNLPDGYTMTETELDYNRVLDTMLVGTEITYRIAANPTAVRTRTTGSGVHKQRVPLCGEAADDWWTNRAQQSGLTVVLFDSVAEDARMFGKGNATLHVVNFSGQAHIEDVNKFRASITIGVGRGKSYGTGLLLAAPSTGAFAAIS